MKLTLLVVLLLVIIQLPAYAKNQHFQVGVEGGYNFSFKSNPAYNDGWPVAAKFEINGLGIRYTFNYKIALDNTELHLFDIYYKFIPKGSGIKPYFEIGGGYGMYKPPADKLHGVHDFATFGIMKKMDRRPIIFEIFGRYNGVFAKTNGVFEVGKNWLYHNFVTVGAGISVGF